MNIKTLLKKTILSRHKIKPFNIDAAKVVILGTFPGEESLKHKRYYDNPKNQIWYVLGIKEIDYENRKKSLEEKGIGLWDVLAYCERYDKGKDTSLDKHIKNEVYNDLSALKGKTILFNGQIAYDYYRKSNLDYGLDEDKMWIMPSTSSAYSAKKEDKRDEWQRILKKYGIKIKKAQK